jgi:hypothetical protein
MINQKTIRIKYSPSAACPAPCSGMIAYDARYTENLPIGLGFAPGSTKFQVDSIQVKGFKGQCMKCGATVLAWKSKRHVTRRPRGINRKIAAKLS